MTLEDIYTTLRDQRMITGFESPPPSTPLARPKPRGRGRPPKNPRPQPVADDESLEGKVPKVDVPKRYRIVPNREVIAADLAKYEAKGYLKLQPERLKYTPFLTTRSAPQPPPLASAVSGNRAAIKNAERPRGFESATPSSGNKDVLATPVDENDDGLGEADAEGEPVTPDPPEKINAGEDKATLELVAALSSSPVRSLRKRPSNEASVEGSPTKRLRSSLAPSSMSPGDGMSRRRSLRGVTGAEIETATPVRSPRKTVNHTSRRGSTQSTPRNRRPSAATASWEEDEDAWGDEDAEGEDDEEYMEV